MKLPIIRIVAALGVFALSSLANAGVALIAHPDTAVSSLDAQQVLKIYMGRTSNLPDGSAVVPLDQAEGSPIRSEFVTRVLGKTEQQLRSFWSREIFTGKGQPPRSVGSSADVIRMVTSRPGYVGYIDSKDVTPKVKVLLRVD